MKENIKINNKINNKKIKKGKSSKYSKINQKENDIYNLKLINLKSFSKNKSVKRILLLIYIFISFPIIILNKNKIRKLNLFSEITLTINGNGDQNILSEEIRTDKLNFDIIPSEILVNGINQNRFGFKVYGLVKQINVITMRWNIIITDCSYMFYKLTNITIIDFSKFNFSKVTSMLKMFQDCISLTSINFNNIDTSSVSDMRNLFVNCNSLKSLDLSYFDTSSVNRMSSMFYFCSSLTTLDLSNFDTSLVTNMESMFYGCNSLISLDLSNFNTLKVTDMQSMFKECKSLKFLNISSFVTSSVTNMQRMFSSCRVLTSLDISNFDTSLVTDMEQMFFNNKLLTSLNLSSFNTEKVFNMYRMFNGCTSLISLDLNNFKTSSVENMMEMFQNCNSLTSININNFDISKVTTLSKMFSKCNSLISLNLNSFQVSNNKNFNDMFFNCNNNMVYCINENNILSQLALNNPNFKNNCSDICFDKIKKYKFTEDKTCIYSCNDGNYNFEYNDICYKSCPKGTHNSYESNLCEEDSKCSIINFFNNLCIINDNDNKDLTGENKIVNDIRNDLLNNSLNLLIDKVIKEEKNDLLVKKDNAIYLLTSSDNQINKEYTNISSINLGKCQTELKKFYNITDNETLIIFKIDYFQKDSLVPIVEYEVYDPNITQRLNLNICENIKIDISIPVSIDENNLFKYNSSSEYYNDLCFPYTTEKGTDIILEDRKNEYNNYSLCEDNCDYKGYNISTKKSSCSCRIKTNLNIDSKVFDVKKLLTNFIDVKNKINIYTMKCINLVFSKDGLKNNIGSYILLSIILINIILVIIFILCGFKMFKNKINIFLKSSNKNNKNMIEKNIVSIYYKKKDSNKTNFKKKNIGEKKLNKKKLDEKKIENEKNYNKVIVKNNPIKRTNKGRANTTIQKFSNSNSNNNIMLNLIEKIDNKKKSKIVFTSTNKNKIHKNNLRVNSKINNKVIKYNDYELNNLSYKKAIKIDKRTYFEYYFSLLKRNHLLLFTFYTKDDFNSKIIKISLFLFSFSLYFTINTLFFSDSIMHKIYTDEGTYDFIYQLPLIIYSTIISSLISVIVKLLSLTEKNILAIKNSKEKLKQNLTRTLKCLIIKFNLFFIINFLFLILFWYYLTSFCSVYKNTQIYLIKDTLISFGLSLLYPFGLNLIPGIFRIQALNAEKKDKECMYKFSLVIQFI